MVNIMKEAFTQCGGNTEREYSTQPEGIVMDGISQRMTPELANLEIEEHSEVRWSSISKSTQVCSNDVGATSSPIVFRCKMCIRER